MPEISGFGNQDNEAWALCTLCLCGKTSGKIAADRFDRLKVPSMVEGLTESAYPSQSRISIAPYSRQIRSSRS